MVRFVGTRRRAGWAPGAEAFGIRRRPLVFRYRHLLPTSARALLKRSGLIGLEGLEDHNRREIEPDHIGLPRLRIGAQEATLFELLNVAANRARALAGLRGDVGVRGPDLAVIPRHIGKREERQEERPFLRTQARRDLRPRPDRDFRAHAGDLRARRTTLHLGLGIAPPYKALMLRAGAAGNGPAPCPWLRLIWAPVPSPTILRACRSTRSAATHHVRPSRRKPPPLRGRADVALSLRGVGFWRCRRPECAKGSRGDQARTSRFRYPTKPILAAPAWRRAQAAGRC